MITKKIGMTGGENGRAKHQKLIAARLHPTINNHLNEYIPLNIATTLCIMRLSPRSE